jgi:hypothetical protein
MIRHALCRRLDKQLGRGQPEKGNIYESFVSLFLLRYRCERAVRTNNMYQVLSLDTMPFDMKSDMEFMVALALWVQILRHSNSSFVSGVGFGSRRCNLAAR